MIAALMAIMVVAGLPIQDRRHPTASQTIDGAVVLSQSPRPIFGSGIVAVWAEIDVAAPDGDRQRMYLIYGGPDDFIPPVGSVCRVVFEPAPIRGVSHDRSLEGRELRNRVEQLDCDTGNWISF